MVSPLPGIFSDRHDLPKSAIDSFPGGDGRGQNLGQTALRDALLGLGLLWGAFALVLWPEQSMGAMGDGLALCANVILPSLFPFFVLSSLVVELGLTPVLGPAAGTRHGPFVPG